MKMILILALAALLAACGSPAPKHSEAASLAPVSVQTVQVQTEEWPVTYEAAGTVRARTITTISSRVMGYVRDVLAQPGDAVRAGQLLAVIDSRELDARLQQAEAAEAEARSAIAEADNGIAAASAQLELARSTFNRMQRLHTQASISDHEFDEAQARLRSAEAQLQMARSKRTQLDAKIAQAAQAVESASVLRGYTRIHAPFAGVITEKPAQPGQLASPGTPLLTVEQVGTYRLEAPLEESLLGSVRLGQTVQVDLDAYDQTLTARIDEIVPAVDAQSRTFLVKAALPAAANLRSGLFGRLRIERGANEVVVVPDDAIRQRGELKTVLMAENGVARTRMVTVGSRRDGRSEILSGLSPGERIVYPRLANLADGVRLEAR
jgi:RND family efflux transporter MFP subunit